jgi:uncharacterized integral membrane protein
MKRFLKAVFLFVIGIAFIAFSVANRHSVDFIVDPFIDRTQAYAVSAPLYVYLFASLFTGIVIGAMSMWLAQGRWRKTARSEKREAAIWKREAENLKRGLQSSAAVNAIPSSPHKALPA